jgi:hypothetical protein
VDAAKKYLLYAIVLLVLALGALFTHKLFELRWYAENPEPTGGSIQRARTPSPRETETVFSRPSGRVPMNTAELAWMLREKLALDIMERMAVGQAEIKAYNDRAGEYNRLSGSIEYRQSDMLAAERLVEGLKEDIVRETDAEAMSLAIPLSAQGDDRAQEVWRVQKYLKLLGYYPGEANGLENESTISAVKMFELKSGEDITGKIDERLSNALREFWISRNVPAGVGFGKDD